MGEFNGSIQLIARKTWCWKLGNPDSQNRWISDFISGDKELNIFYFIIIPSEEKHGFSSLSLCEEEGSKCKTHYLRISLRYSSEKKLLNLKSSFLLEDYGWCAYHLADIETDNLLEIKFKIFKTTGDKSKGTGKIFILK